MRKKIAIIIPAYKSRFLQQTLASIAARTNNSFTVYIGDDVSPHDLKNIVCLYHDKLDIVYHCFEENLGKQDLPGHWERCIAMSKEPIVWLFSDDDLMPCDGIERILKVLDKCGERNIMLRFPLALIDGGNNVIYENSPFTDEMIQDGRTAEQINSSIIVTTGNYYAINAKVSEEQQKQAVEFLKWMEKEENVQKWIIDSFKFIPYNVTPEMKLENPLSESIQKYLSAGQTFNDTVVGTPKTWSGEKVGTALLEQYIGKEEWDDETLDQIADLCVNSWKELKSE